MRRGTIVIALFILIVAGVIGAVFFLRNQPPLEITLAVDPLAADWMEEAVQNFNASDITINNTQRIHLTYTVIPDFDVWQDTPWTAQNHPDGWLASSSTATTYANMPLQIIAPSTARTLLVWGAYTSRANVLTDDGTIPLDWAQVINAAETENWGLLGGEENWRFVKLAFSLPDSTTIGLAALFSGAAAVAENVNISGATRGADFEDQIGAVVNRVPNFNTIGADAAAFMARGISQAEIALAPESQWLNNLQGIVRNEPIMFSYPEYAFVFDFPLAAYEDTTDPQNADAIAAVQAFGAWLLRPEQQATLGNYGLRPVNNAPSEPNDLFAAGEQYGIQRNPIISAIIQPPNVNEARALIQWFGTVSR